MNGHDVTNETHREGCAECRAVWADLERISADARALPRLTPSRDLWAGIEARISGAATTGARTRARHRWTASPTLRFAIAASLLMAVTSVVTWELATRGTPTVADAALDAASEEPIPNPAPGDAGLSRAAALREAAYEMDYSRLDGEVRALQLIVDERLPVLDPRTVAVLERNLALIDTAIAESRKALMADPASAFLATELARAYTVKLSLLRTTAKLPAGT